MKGLRDFANVSPSPKSGISRKKIVCTEKVYGNKLVCGFPEFSLSSALINARKGFVSRKKAILLEKV